MLWLGLTHILRGVPRGMIGVVLARLVFALAAASALLASNGLAAPPHRVEPGTPLYHTLVLGAYRFAFLLEPADTTSALSPAMAALHKALALVGMPVTNMPGMEAERPRSDDGLVIATAGLDPVQELGFAFALLVVLVPRLPRPTRRPLAVVPPPHIGASLWQPAPPMTPPRLAALPYAIS